MKNFSNKKSEKVEKRFIPFQATHPDISNPMVIMLLFIIYLHPLLNFPYT